MIVNSFASYVMRGRREAMFCAMLTAVLPLLSWLSIVIICLVTLRKGIKEGAIILLAAIIPAIVVSVFFLSPLLILENILFSYVAVWLLACVLLQTISWSYVIEIAGLLALISIVAVHLIVPDIQQVYAKYLLVIYNKFSAQQATALTLEDAKQYIAFLAKYMTGFQAGLYLVGGLSNLGIARYLQARLYNPGGLSQELMQIRLDWLVGIMLVVSLYGAMMEWRVLTDWLLVVILLYIIAAVSLIHYLAKSRPHSMVYLVACYVALIIFLPYSLIPLVALSFIDIWVDLRTRLVPSSVGR